jgi:hypothetical protein
MAKEITGAVDALVRAGHAQQSVTVVDRPGEWVAWPGLL